LGEQHLDAREGEEGRKDQRHPLVVRHQFCTDRDHDAPQHDHTDDAPDQSAILVLPWDGEVSEDQRDDEDVVDREDLLDDVALEV
jgi:hypothetical protein